MQQSLTEYIDQLQTTTAQEAAMESELSIARSIQLSMVPTEFPELEHVDLYASMTPAKAVIDRMIQAVHTFVGDAEQSDDLTLLSLSYK